MHEGDTKPKGVHWLNKKYSSETLMWLEEKTDGVVKKTAGHQLLYVSVYQHLDLGI